MISISLSSSIVKNISTNLYLKVQLFLKLHIWKFSHLMRKNSKGSIYYVNLILIPEAIQNQICLIRSNTPYYSL